MNRPFSQAGWPANTEDPGALWIDHTRAVYRVMEELRALKPGLLIESCSGGGGRVDLGMIARSDLFWTSDNTDALDRQRIQEGFSQVYPAVTMSNWVTDSPNPITGRRIPLAYRFHVAMAGMLGIGGDLLTWSEQELREAASLVAEYKSIRETVQFGEVHRLGGQPGRDLSAVQYVHGAEVVVIAYEPRRSLDSGRRLFRLAGLDPSADYVDGRTGERFSGRWLMEQGLDLWHGTGQHGENGTLRFSRGDYSSALVRLREARIATHSTPADRIADA
jgi:alpha-galactosidase